MPRHITVLLPNQPGELFQLSEVLAKNSVNIWAFHLANTGRSGFVQLICDPHETAMRALSAHYKFYASENEVVAVAIPNTPGALMEVLRILSDNGANIAHSYQILDKTGASVVVLDFDAADERLSAERALRENNFRLLDEVP